MSRLRSCLAIGLVLTVAAPSLAAAPIAAGEPNPPQAPDIAPASQEAAQAMAGFQKPEGWSIDLFAAEPRLANPAAIDVDDQGRVWVCETFRQGRAVEDNRNHPEWLDDDLAAQTVEDRLAYLKKHLKERIVDYTEHDDRIRVLVDSDGDGRADQATVFADRFNDVLEGTGASVLAHQGNVYYTNIPHLWLLRDADGDLQADRRESLHYGFGVRYAFRGHDLHGLTIGPDGRLYFSIGDRGYNVRTDDGRLADPESGAVFRCELDGSNLEVIATGLRNPQELAFDKHGNLFTGDNNSDSGDQARWVYVVEGGDSGWRMAYQYLPDRGPFNRERIWHPYRADEATAAVQPAYIVPPVANVSDGPSGLAYYPGVGLSDAYNDRFFLCDFRGGPANSGVRTIRVEPQGAGFKLVENEQTLWNILATDIDFGPDGRIYVSDWVEGWTNPRKGRIYRFFDPREIKNPVVAEVQQLLAEDLADHTNQQLNELLSHADMRVRMAAQFELAERGDETTFTLIAKDETAPRLARLHALWGLDQIARGHAQSPRAVSPAAASEKTLDIVALLLDDSDAEVRAQAAKLAGEHQIAAATDKLIERLEDENLRVRYFAAQSLGKSGAKSTVLPLLEMLAANNDEDPVLRHGGVMGLAGVADREALAEAVEHPSAAARMGALLAMRRLEMPEIARFLNDADPQLIVEAARAIHDVPIPEAMPALAAILDRSSDSDPLLRRALNANFRLGEAENAEQVAQFAAREAAPEAMRIEALEMLADWSDPSPRDRVLNMWRPLEKRDPSIAKEAVRQALAGVMTGPADVQAEAVQTAAALGIQEVGPVLHTLLNDATAAGEARADALLALASLKNDRLTGSVEESLDDDDPHVRAAARRVIAQLDPARAVKLLDKAVRSGEMIERHDALAVLGELEHSAAEEALSAALDRLLAGDIPADTRLDVVAAARARESSQLANKLAEYEASLPQDEPAGAWRDSLVGGNAERGAQIFFERTEVSCVRCHAINDRGGQVGPDLSKIAAEKDRRYLLEAIVAPNANIAKNFESVVLATDDGRILSGVVRREGDDMLEIMDADGNLLSIPQESIEQLKPGKSPMPEDISKQLTPRDVRDLVEFLSGLK